MRATGARQLLGQGEQNSQGRQQRAGETVCRGWRNWLQHAARSPERAPPPTHRRALGLQSLPVAFGVDTAKWICVGTIDVTQLGVAAYLWQGLHQPTYAAVLLGLILPQIFFQIKYFLPDPIANDVKYQVRRACCVCVYGGRGAWCLLGVTRTGARGHRSGAGAQLPGVPDVWAWWQRVDGAGGPRCLWPCG